MANEYTFAIIPTNGRDCFKQCLAAVEVQVDKVIVVEGGPNVPNLDWATSHIIREPDLNISKWWNLGLSLVDSHVHESGTKKWNVVILNDDAIIPKGWVYAVSEKMREMKAAAACSGSPHQMPVFHTQPGPVDLRTRLQGFAFMLAGEKGVRANEQLRWYFSDDHVDWLSRQLGGMVTIPGFPVNHLYPNQQMTPEMHQMVAEDAAAFVAYWGARPW